MLYTHGSCGVSESRVESVYRRVLACMLYHVHWFPSGTRLSSLHCIRLYMITPWQLMPDLTAARSRVVCPISRASGCTHTRTGGVLRTELTPSSAVRHLAPSFYFTKVRAAEAPHNSFASPAICTCACGFLRSSRARVASIAVRAGVGSALGVAGGRPLGGYSCSQKKDLARARSKIIL